MSVKTYLGADVSSDHNSVVATVSIRLKKLLPSMKRLRIDTAKLRQRDIKRELHAKLNRRVIELQQQELLLPEDPS